MDKKFQDRVMKLLRSKVSKKCRRCREMSLIDKFTKVVLRRMPRIMTEELIKDIQEAK
jgi:hypothetical protein